MVRQSDIGPLFPDNCYFVFIPPSLVTLASFETNVYIVCPVFQCELIAADTGVDVIAHLFFLSFTDAFVR